KFAHHVQPVHRLARVDENGPFGKLDIESTRGKMVALERFTHHIHEVVASKMPWGGTDHDWKIDVMTVAQLPHVVTGLLDFPVADGNDQACFLRHPNELGRMQQAA